MIINLTTVLEMRMPFEWRSVFVSRSGFPTTLVERSDSMPPSIAEAPERSPIHDIRCVFGNSPCLTSIVTDTITH
jgi:hypothetical protein